MSFLLAGAIATSLLIIACAMVLVIKSKGDKGRQWLALFLVFGALWSLIINFESPTWGYVYNLWIVWLTFIAAILMVYSMFRFALVTSQKELPNWLAHTVKGVTSVAVLGTGLGWVTPSIKIVGDQVIPQRALAYFVIIIFILVLITVSIDQLWRYQRSIQNYRERHRIQIIMIGLIAAISAGIFTNIILPNVTGSILPARYGWMAITIWTAILLYAVIRHRFLDVRLAAVRTVAYFMALTVITTIYFSIAFLVSRVVSHSLSSVATAVTSVAMALFLALLFEPTKRYFNKQTNRIFYRDNYSADEFFARLTRKLSVTTDLRSLLTTASEEIVNTVKAEFGFFYVQYGENRQMTAGTKNRPHVNFKDLQSLEAYVSSQCNGSVIQVELFVASEELNETLRRQKVELILPLFKDKKVLGYLFLGPQRTRDYSSRDIRTLNTISDELMIAVQNALYVQEVQEFNETLKGRIESATKELRQSNNQLQKLDEAKDEFVSMASHQLRTPLTSVKGYISMVLEGDAGAISPMQKQLLGEAFTSSERMVHLINDFLNVSRLQTGKFMVDRRPIDLAKVTSQEVESLQTTATAHSLKLKYRTPAYFPILHMDEGKIRQVIMNFIDNAIYYSKEHTTITIKLYVDEGDVVLEVHDTGIGVPENEREHLFTKFFRASNARKQRPDGTGVGLFLAKKVVVAHGGRMVFDSVEGEGSTFGFRLPVKKLSAADDANDFDQ